MNRTSKIINQVGMVMILVALCLVPAMAEDGVYILDRAQGLHRLGNTPATNLDTLSPSSVDFEVSENGLEIFALEPEGMIRSNKAGAPVLGKALQQTTARRMAISRLGYVLMDNEGTIHFSEGQPDPGWNAYFGWDIARDVELTLEGDGMVVLDGYGNLHVRGNSPVKQTPYFGWDVARDVEYSPEEDGYYILDGFGNIHSVGDIPSLQGENLGWDIARDLELTQTGQGFYVLDGFGGLHVGGDALPFAVPYFGWDVATDMEISPQPRGRLVGSVFAVNADGTQSPLSRAFVVLRRIDIPEDAVRELPGNQAQHGSGALQTRTHRDGSYRFPPLPAGQYSVTVTAAGFGTLTAEVDILSGEEITRDFVLTPGNVPPPSEYGRIEGTVAVDVGMLTVYIPIPNARVKLWLSNTQVLVTRTNEDGQFSFDRVPPGRHPIQAEAEGFYPEDDRIQVEPGQTAGIAFQLEKREESEPGRVYGTVWTASGEELYLEPADNAPLVQIPVEGALVKIIPLDGPGFRDPFDGENFIPRADQYGHETRTNEDGFYEFNDVSPGAYVLLVESEGFKPERRWFRLGDCSIPCNEKEINVQLFPTPTDFGIIKGNVSGLSPDATGTVIPLDGALVHAVPVLSVTPTLDYHGFSNRNDEWRTGRFVARTNEEGDYLFEGLPAGHYQLFVTARGYLAEQRQVMLEAGQELIENFLLLPIVHETGAIAGFVFSASCPMVQPADPTVTEITATNCPIEGAVVVLLPKPRPVGALDEAVPVIDEVLEEIPLMPELISDLEVNRRFRSVTTAADGSYSFENVPVGHYQLVARARGFLPGHEEADVFSNTTTELDFLLRPAPPPKFGGLVGSVTGTLDGMPVEDAVVTAWPVHFTDMELPELDTNAFDSPEDHPWAPRPFRTRTDEEGNYEFETLPVGPYRITVRARGYEPASAPVLIENEVVKVLNFGLQPGPAPGSVIGRVMTDEGDASIPPRPIEGATVKLIPLDVVLAGNLEEGGRNDSTDPAGQIFRTRTDDEGRYEFPSIPAGPYLLMVQKHNFLPQRRRIEAPPGATVEENFSLQPAGSPATGTVLVSVFGPTEDPATDGIIPIPGAWVFLSRWNNQPIDGGLCAGCIEEGLFARTDENGQCQFENVRPGAYKLLVRAEGFKPDFRKIVVHPEEVIHAEFLLDRHGNEGEGKVFGHVYELNETDGPPQPAAHAKVTLAMPLPTNLDNTAPRKAGDREGDNPHYPGVLTTWTNAEGYYEFNSVKPGEYGLFAEKPGYQTAEETIFLASGEALEQDLEMEVIGQSPGDGSLSGTVSAQDTAGTISPLSDVTVKLFGVNIRLGLETTTNNAGEYVFPEVPAGPFKVVIHEEGYEPFEQIMEIVEGEATVLDIVLNPDPTQPQDAALVGMVYVRDASGNLSPLPQAKVKAGPQFVHTLDEGSWRYYPETYSNDDGSYRLEPIVPANEMPYKITASKLGYTSDETLLNFYPGDELTHDFILEAQEVPPARGTAVIHGIVLTLPPGAAPGDHITRDDLVPLPDATVYLGRDFGVVDGAADGQTDPNEPVPDFSQAFKITQTDSAGSFVFDQLDSGRWVVIADKEGFHWDAGVIFLDEGEIGRMTIVIIPLLSDEPSAGVVKGIVTAPGERGNRRAPVAGAQVMISSPSIPTFAPVETETDRFGHFNFEPVPAAEDYRVVVEAEGLNTYEEDFAVQPGQITFLNCEMQPAGENERPPVESAALIY